MLSSNKKLQIAGAIATLLAFAVGVGCNGFFVDPTITGVTVGPTTSIAIGGTVQMSAVGTYSDGSTKVLGSGVYWSSSDTSVATVTSSGLVKGVSANTATITGSYQTQSGSATITVELSNISSITVSSGGVTTCPAGGSQQFTATAMPGSVDITTSATWTISNPNAGTIVSSGDSGGLLTCASPTTAQTTTISATEDGVIGTETNFTVEAQ